MIINNVELPDIDVSDALVMERYEMAHDSVSVAMNNLQTGKRQSEVIRAECNAIFNFFDLAFGDGAAKKVFGDSVNLTICINAYSDVIKQVKALSTKLANSYKSNALAITNRNNHNKKNHNKGKKYNHYKKPLTIKQVK